MVVAGGCVREHVMDERAALVCQHLAEAVLFGGEVLVERRLRHLRAAHDGADRRLLIAEVGEQVQGRMHQTLPAVSMPRACAPLPGDKHLGGGRHGLSLRLQFWAIAREMTSRWISLVPSNKV